MLTNLTVCWCQIRVPEDNIDLLEYMFTDITVYIPKIALIPILHKLNNNISHIYGDEYGYRKKKPVAYFVQYQNSS